MAFEINLEVYTFQVRNKGEKEFFYTLDSFSENEDIIPFFKEFTNFYSKMKISEIQQKSIQFTDEVRITSNQRIISGILESGDYGVERWMPNQNITPFTGQIKSNSHIGLLKTIQESILIHN